MSVFGRVNCTLSAVGCIVTCSLQLIKLGSEARWPHYLLGAYYDEDDIRKNDFSAPSYYLKVDYPEQYSLNETKYIPAGNYACFLIKIEGATLPDAVMKFLNCLKNENVKITGKLFVMDVVNSLITSDAEKYCTMLYAKISEPE
jgi:DNA gyrase inhibitor GyrI